MTFEIIPACDLSFADQAQVANLAFADYVAGWTDLDATSLARFLHLQGADVFYSRFIRHADGVAGFGYINRTARVLRLGAMALIPSARGTGAAGQLLQHLLGEARARGDATMMLEVIQQNPRAVVFYRRLGFREIAPLHGWRRKPLTLRETEPPSSMREVSVAEALRTAAGPDHPDIPWPISRYSLTRVERTQAFAAGAARIVISDPKVNPIRIHGLFCESGRWAELLALVRGVLDRDPEREYFAPPVWPEEFGREIFEPCGFTREPLSQFLMRFDL